MRETSAGVEKRGEVWKRERILPGKNGMTQVTFPQTQSVQHTIMGEEGFLSPFSLINEEEIYVAV